MGNQRKEADDSVSLYPRLAFWSVTEDKVEHDFEHLSLFVNIPDVQIMDVGYQDTLRELFLLFVVYFFFKYNFIYLVSRL